MYKSYQRRINSIYERKKLDNLYKKYYYLVMQFFSKSDLDRVRKQFNAEGVTVRQWAIREGFSPGQVYQVMAGRVSCLRGKSHLIAQRLGLKPIVDKAHFAVEPVEGDA
jgi:gp16 family phage-associated protein